MTDDGVPRVLLTFDFEEWEGQNGACEADLYSKTRRLVNLLKERDLPATFFLDAETVLKYPDAARLLVDERFELALHSDRHFRTNIDSLRALDFASQSSQVQVSRMEEAIRMIRTVMPEFDPKGFRSPGLRWNEALYTSLRTLGFLYDSSQQSRFAFRPFYKNGVLVIPVNCGDYDSALYKVRAQFVVAVWKDNFRRACEAAAKNGGEYFMLLGHPSVCGRFKYLGIMKAILNHMSWSHPEYLTCRDFAVKATNSPEMVSRQATT